MKKVIFNLLQAALCLALIVLFCTHCSKSEPDSFHAVGKLSLNLGISVKTHDVYNSLKAARPEEFLVIIYNADGSEYQSYAAASEIPAEILINEGSYYVVAHSDNDLVAAFENDYYFGQTEVFSIIAGETTSIDLTCVLANIMVSVVYSASVISDFESYETIVSNPGGSLNFGMNESRAGYFNEGPLDLMANLNYTDASGVPQTLTLSGNVSDAEAGKHYEIHIDASLSNGSVSINIMADENYETQVIRLNSDSTGNLMSGELLITEIMYNPSALGDGTGEYIELMNVSSTTVNLNTLVLRRGSNNDLHIINEDVFIAAGEYAVLGISAEACPTVDYVYSGLSLINGGDEIILNTQGSNGIDGDVICKVDYGAVNFPTGLNGSSIQLTNEILDVNEALDGTNWCESTISFSTGDNGTPGLVNHDCQ